MNINFLGNRRYLYLLGCFTFIASPLIMLLKGFNWGLDFTGGSEFRYQTKSEVTAEQIRKLITESDLAGLAKDIDVQQITTGAAAGGTVEFNIRSGVDLSREKGFEPRLTDLLKTIPGGGVEHRATQIIGPVVGAKLVKDTQLAVIISVILILVYVCLRFEFRHGVAAIIALIHDALGVLGMVALSGVSMDINVVAAVLTVIGYSINDTIVILDRMRENNRLYKKRPFEELTNMALNQTLSRTIWTSTATLMSLLALWLIGPDVLRSFCFAMVVGFIAGTLSTICLVCPIIVDWYYWDHPQKAGEMGEKGEPEGK